MSDNILKEKYAKYFKALKSFQKCVDKKCIVDVETKPNQYYFSKRIADNCGNKAKKVHKERK